MCVLRRPEALLNPQLHAEDGSRWFVQAYHNGAYAFWLPAGGYYQTFSRSVAATAQRVPLERVPLYFNALALLVEILPPLFLLGGRFQDVLPSRRWRLAIALLWIAVPASFETRLNVTNSMTHLGLLALLVLVADPPLTVAAATTDILALGVAGISGPFVMFQAPLAAAIAWSRRTRSAIAYATITIALAALQASTFLRASEDRTKAALGASVPLFFRIVGGNVFTAGLIGVRGYRTLRRYHVLDALLVPVLGLAAIAFLGYCMARGPRALRHLVLFGSLVLAAALYRPQVSPTPPQWDVLVGPGSGNRYFTPILIALVTSVAWAAFRAPSRLPRNAARIFLALLLSIGIPVDFRDRRQPDLHWADQVARFRAAPPGTRVHFDILPEPWSFGLVKPWDAGRSDRGPSHAAPEPPTQR